ncbi:lytic transglycosylase domain-containing protein [Paracidovorax citrulli]
MRVVATVVLVSLAGLSPQALAAGQNYCWEEAGARYGVDPLLLYSIAKQESGFNNRATNRNKNGTEDVCMMQVNSIHLPQLARYGITRERLMAEPCTCINTGAWVLAGAYAYYGVPWREGVDWEGVGAYNAGMKRSAEQQRKRDRYSSSVRRIYMDAAARSR